jgi:hypothetical protein
VAPVRARRLKCRVGVGGPGPPDGNHGHSRASSACNFPLPTTLSRARTEQPEGTRGPARGPMNAASRPLKTEKTRCHRGSRSGETRTRTGDTTIFSRSLETLEPGGKPRKHAGSRNSLACAGPRRFHSFHGDSGDDPGFIAFLANAQPGMTDTRAESPGEQAQGGGSSLFSRPTPPEYCNRTPRR